MQTLEEVLELQTPEQQLLLVGLELGSSLVVYLAIFREEAAVSVQITQV